MNSPQKTIPRSELKLLLDAHIYEQLSYDQYPISWLKPQTLLTPNRLDLAFRLFYLSKRLSYHELASTAYKEDIRAQSLGAFQDPHNPNKSNHNDFKNSFDILAYSIKTQSFDIAQGLVPLASDCSILNGSHRVASSIYYGTEVACVHTELDPYTINDIFYSRRDVDDVLLSASIREYLEYSPNSYIACLWPSSHAIHRQAIDIIPNKIAIRRLKSTFPSALSILYLCYRGMDWIGTPSTNYSGLYSKLFETFPAFDTLTAIAFTSPSLDEVKRLKQSIRRLTNLKFSSIHITDTPQEAISLSRILFNPSHYEFLLRISDRTPVEHITKLSTLLDSPHPAISSPYTTPVASVKDLSSTLTLDTQTFSIDQSLVSLSARQLPIQLRPTKVPFFISVTTWLTSCVHSAIYRGFVLKHAARTVVVATLTRLSLYSTVKYLFKRSRNR